MNARIAKFTSEAIGVIGNRLAAILGRAKLWLPSHCQWSRP